MNALVDGGERLVTDTVSRSVAYRDLARGASRKGVTRVAKTGEEKMLSWVTPGRMASLAFDIPEPQHARSRPLAGAVLDCLGDVGSTDWIAAGEIGNGARELEQSVVGTGREA